MCNQILVYLPGPRYDTAAEYGDAYRTAYGDENAEYVNGAGIRMVGFGSGAGAASPHPTHSVTNNT